MRAALEIDLSTANDGERERERALVREIALYSAFLTKHEQERLSHFDANQNETHRFYKAHSLSSHCISVLLNFPNSLTAFLYLKIHSSYFLNSTERS